MKKTGYKEIFIFIAGSTPQIITETIYSLATQKPPVYPDGIYIITTSRGQKIIENSIIKNRIIENLVKEYDLPEISITGDSFVIPQDSAGNPLDDIKSASENEAMGNLITSFIREKTNDPSARLHCSLAGGRKTMSFYIGAAMQLFGRTWDKLYHVLVSPEFESSHDFFYKPAKDRVIEVNGKKLNTRDASITLAELPFIRLRNKLHFDASDFSGLVKEGQKEIDTAMVQPELKVNLPKRLLLIGQKTVKLTPVHLMIYMAYLKHKLNRCKYPERPYCYDCTDCFPSLLELATKPALEEMAKDYMVMYPSRTGDLLHKNKDGLSLDILRQSISKIRKAIAKEISDETMASYYSITTSFRGYSNTRHGIRVEKSKIKILNFQC